MIELVQYHWTLVGWIERSEIHHSGGLNRIPHAIRFFTVYPDQIGGFRYAQSTLQTSNNFYA